mgnify:CR=1 FL=1
MVCHLPYDHNNRQRSRLNKGYRDARQRNKQHFTSLTVAVNLVLDLCACIDRAAARAINYISSAQPALSEKARWRKERATCLCK